MTGIKRGFAAMSPERRREIASMGGRAANPETNPGSFANRPTSEVSAAGRKGGLRSVKVKRVKREAQS